jgi:hypothetical protein
MTNTLKGFGLVDGIVAQSATDPFCEPLSNKVAADAAYFSFAFIFWAKCFLKGFYLFLDLAGISC